LLKNREPINKAKGFLNNLKRSAEPKKYYFANSEESYMGYIQKLFRLMKIKNQCLEDEALGAGPRKRTL
jgi:hypothetical protein